MTAAPDWATSRHEHPLRAVAATSHLRAALALRVSRIARRPVRLLRVHRLHCAGRAGDRRRRLGRGLLERGAGARGPGAARRRRGVLADPARGQAGRAGLSALARKSVAGGDAARHGAHRRRPAGAGRIEGGRRRLSVAGQADARSATADAGIAGRARRRPWRRRRRRVAGAARPQGRRPRPCRPGAVRDPQRARRRARQAVRRGRFRAAVPDQRRRPARHAIVAAGHAGALDLSRGAAAKYRRRCRRPAARR